MIAGLIMGGTMIGVSKLAAQAMAGNNNQISRANIEAAINNDMQMIQQKDSQLTYQWIEEMITQRPHVQIQAAILRR